MKALLPRMRAEDLESINIDKLKALGIKALFCDVDNTLAHDKVSILAEGSAAWVERMKSAGFVVCLVSNNRKKRVGLIAAELGVPYVDMALKPLGVGLKRAARLVGVTPKESCVVGDQVFTDVWGANRVGMYSVLVKPLSPKEGFMTKIKRPLEKYILKGYVADE